MLVARWQGLGTRTDGCYGLGVHCSVGSAAVMAHILFN